MFHPQVLTHGLQLSYGVLLLLILRRWEEPAAAAAISSGGSDEVGGGDLDDGGHTANSASMAIKLDPVENHEVATAIVAASTASTRWIEAGAVFFLSFRL